MKIESTFALLDVQRGRQKLSKHFDVAQRMAPEKRIPVTIKGLIVGQWGHDDGTSIEFQVEVSTVTTDD